MHTPFDVEQINRLIRNRRSIYPNMFSGERINDAIIEQMLENANWAPTHALTEPWRFKVFTGNGLQQLADFQSGLYRKKSQEAGNYEEQKFQKLAQKPLQCSHIISIGMKRDPKEKIDQVEEIEAVACAVQNMYLTATAYGIGCYWGSGGITYWPESLDYFDLGPKDRLLGFLYIGIPKTKWPEGRRKPLSEKVSWVR
jgi:nitroreductase